MARGDLDDVVEFLARPCGRLLDQHVLTALNRGARDLGEHIIGRRHDDDIDVCADDGRAPVLGRLLREVSFPPGNTASRGEP